jgi:hypothetical protein
MVLSMMLTLQNEALRIAGSMAIKDARESNELSQYCWNR